MLFTVSTAEPGPWERRSVAPLLAILRPRSTYKGATTTGEAMTTAEHTDEALGRSRGGFSTKIHLRAEGGGKPIALLIMAGQRHEQTVFKTLMETGAVKRVGQGKPCMRPERVVGDRGYSSRKIRRYVCKRGIGAVIARQKGERRRGRFTSTS